MIQGSFEEVVAATTRGSGWGLSGSQFASDGRWRLLEHVNGGMDGVDEATDGRG